MKRVWFRSAVLAWPGVAHAGLGLRLTGVAYALGFPLSLLFLVVYRQGVLDSLSSLGLTLWFIIIAPSEAMLHVSEDAAQFWIAGLAAVLLPPALVVLARRGARKAVARAEGEETSEWALAMRHFLANPIAQTGLVVLAVLYSSAIFSPLLAPSPPNVFQDGAVTQYLPPFSTVTALRLRNDPVAAPEPTFSHMPESHAAVARSLHEVQKRLTDDGYRRLRFVEAFHIEGSDVIATIGAERVVILIADLVDPDPAVFVEAHTFLLGTDSFGRDMLSRMLFGARISLSLGFIAVLLSVTLGTAVGLSAGYFGRFVDSALMRFVDVLLAFPSLFLILIIVAMFDEISFPRILLVVLVLGCTSWMGIARLVRSEVLSLKEQDFVLAARAAGLGRLRIIFRHILPNAVTPVIVNATLRIGGMILIEAALSFLNLGVQQPTASWGSIIYEGKDVLARAWWISSFPGITIVLTVVCFNLLGDGLRDAFDPRLKRA